MLQIGRYNTLVVAREVDFGLYLTSREEEVLLPSKYVPKDTRLGDTLRVFVYTDSEDRPVATTLRPLAVVDDVAYLRAKDVAPIGCFLDWGLEKDLLVPRNEQVAPMDKGRRYVVKILLDPKTNRVYGSTRIARHSGKADRDLRVGQQVRLMIYQFSRRGTLVVVDDHFLGMIYHSETFERLRIGERRPGYIQKIREDGKIDLSLKKPGHTSRASSGRRILEALQKSGGFIPCHDKSSPQEIMKVFAMSKKEFKRAIGGLYKQRLIDISTKGIRLLTNQRGENAGNALHPEAER